MQKGGGKGLSEIGLNRNVSALSGLGGDRSIVSGSRTGNQNTIRASQMEDGEEMN